MRYCRINNRECIGYKEFPLLFEISRRLNNSKTIKDELDPIIEMVAKNLNAERALLTILNRQNLSIFIESSYGLSSNARSRGCYKIGEGVIGEVVKTRQPIFIEKENKSKRFLNKTRSKLFTKDRKDLSFVCVPIEIENKIAGTLSIDIAFNEEMNIEGLFKTLSIIGSMVAQAVRARQDKIEELERLKEENEYLHFELRDRWKPDNIIGNSGKMREVFKLIEKVSITNASVLIRGESGVGKELIVDAIHYNSQRGNKPLIKVNCSALPSNLIESELFGYEKGAFTGAEKRNIGRFEAADGGTIFLDEIGDVPISTQIKLLRIIQERVFERVGSTNSITCDVRIITATNRNLEEILQKGEFREDFYYRINVFPIYVPSLRERINDIPLLIDHFIQKCNALNHTSIKRISSGAIDMLMVYHWPGNIRELENCIEHAAILSSDGVIRPQNLPPTLQTALSSNTSEQGTLRVVIEKVEKQLIKDALMNTKGNIAKAAKNLGITERMLGIRIKKYNLEPKTYKRQFK